jgi:hypothetical protein
MEDSPALFVVLTARELLDRADCRDHLRQLRRSLKRQWPSVRWACLVEFQRRGALHLNLLIKGVPVEERDELLEHASRVWCARVDAEPVGQSATVVTDGGGLVRYLSLHFLKPAQAPPIGWRGHRVSYTRDYLVRPASAMREEARRSLTVRRELWRAHQGGHQGADAERVVADALAIIDAGDWKLIGARSPAPAPVSSTAPAGLPADMLTTSIHWRDERQLINEARDLLAGVTHPPGPGRRGVEDHSRAGQATLL